MSSGYYQEAIISMDDLVFTGNAAQDLMAFLNSEAQEREFENEWTAAYVLVKARSKVESLTHLPPELIFSLVRDHLTSVATMPVVEHESEMARIALTVLDQFVGEWRKRGLVAA